MRLIVEPLVVIIKPAPGGGQVARVDGAHVGAEGSGPTWPLALAAALRALAAAVEATPPGDGDGLTAAQLHALVPYGPFRPEGEATVVALLLALSRRLARVEAAARATASANGNCARTDPDPSGRFRPTD